VIGKRPGHWWRAGDRRLHGDRCSQDTHERYVQTAGATLRGFGSNRAPIRNGTKSYSKIMAHFLTNRL
jgi:hypothetical protein